MLTPVIALALVYAIAAALNSVIARFVLRTEKINEAQFLFVQQGINAVFLASAVFWFDEFGTSSRYNAAVFYSAVFVTTAANIVIHFAGARSLRLAEASLVAPIFAMTPALVTVAALYIGEFPSLQGIFGIAFISIGTYLHARENATTLKEYLQPFRLLARPANFALLSGDEQAKIESNRKGLLWAYVRACFGTIGLIADGIAARNGNVALAFAIEAAVLACVFSAPAIKSGWRNSVKVPRVLWMFIAVTGVLYGLEVLSIMTAFRLAPVAYVGSLKRIEIPLTIIFSGYMLGEAAARRRIWPALVITAGAMLLAFDSGISKFIEHLDPGK